MTTFLALCASCCASLLAKRITATIAKGSRRFEDAIDTDTHTDSQRPLDTDLACTIFNFVSALLVGLSSPLVPETAICSVSVVTGVCESMGLVLADMSAGKSPLLMSPILIPPETTALRAAVLRCVSHVAKFALTTPSRTKTFGSVVVKAVLGPMTRVLAARAQEPTSFTAVARLCFEHTHMPRAMLCAVARLSTLTRKLSTAVTTDAAAAAEADGWSDARVRKWLQHFLEDRDSVVRVHAFNAITNTLCKGGAQPLTDANKQLMKQAMQHLSEKSQCHRALAYIHRDTST